MRWVTVGATVYADGGNVPPPVLPSKEEARNIVGPACSALRLALAGLVMVMSLVWALWTIVNRNAHVVRSSQPQFLLLICMGTSIIACSIVAPSLPEPVNPMFLEVACIAFPWFFSLCWFVTLFAIFSETLRIYKLIKRSQKFCRVAVKSKDMLRPFLAPFTFNMILLISWTAIAPMIWTRVDLVSSVDRFGRINSSYATCAPEWPFVILLFALHLSYLLYAILVGYRARHIATEYNETYYIEISAVSMLQAFLVGVGQNPEMSYVIRSILVTLVCGAVLIPLFIPKVKARRREKRYRKVRSLLRAEREKFLVLNRRSKHLKEER